MNNHTPESWAASGQLIITKQSYPHPNPKVQHSPKIIGEVHWSWEGDRGGKEPRISWSEAQANQRLMIAAPKLLSLLVRVQSLGEEVIGHDLLADIDAAIDEAEVKE